RLSATLAVTTLPALASLGHYSAGLQSLPLQQQPLHAQHQQYPQATAGNNHQQQMMPNGYRSSSPLPPSPLLPSPTHHSPQPPSPLELSLSINTNFGNLNSSHHNLPSLFDSSLTMSAQQHQRQQEQQMATRVSVGTSTSPQMGSESNTATNLDPPLVITTTNEDGNEVGFYYAVPTVYLNPAYNDADLFQDCEDFVWIENLFEDPSLEEEAANMGSMSVAATAGSFATGVDNVSQGMGGIDSSAETTGAIANGANDDIQMMSTDTTFGTVNDSIMHQHEPQPPSWMGQGYTPTMQG
ncbi:hypothetical protein BGZ99_008341, partial [Dissophora globulifera]